MQELTAEQRIALESGEPVPCVVGASSSARRYSIACNALLMTTARGRRKR
jgi:hypothetical protein